MTNKSGKLNSYEDIIYKLNYVENNINLKLLSHDGIDIWPIIKYQIGIKYFDNIDGRVDKQLSFWPRVFKKLKQLFQNVFFSAIYSIFFKREENFNFEQNDYIFLSDEYSKRLLIDGKWLDVFTDSFIKIKSINETDFLILRSNQNQSKVKKSFTKEFNISGLALRSFIESMMSTSDIKKDNPMLLETYNDIKTLFGDDIMYIEFPEFKHVISEAALIKKLSLKFEKIIKKVKPKEIILTHYLGYVTAGLCVAAKKYNIKVSDIQHGVQGKLHPAYNYRNFPSNGYTTTPNSFYVWDKSDAENIKLWSDDKAAIETEVIGNPIKYIFEQDIELIKLFNNQFKSVFNDKLNKQLILVTLCWSYYISQVMLDVISEATDESFFLIRFHPNTRKKEKKEVKRKLKKLNKKNYEIENSSLLPLHTLFRYADIHLAIVSTAITEGLEYKIKTIVTGSRGKAYFKENTNKELLIFSDSSVHISNIIREDFESKNE